MILAGFQGRMSCTSACALHGLGRHLGKHFESCARIMCLANHALHNLRPHTVTVSPRRKATVLGNQSPNRTMSSDVRPVAVASASVAKTVALHDELVVASFGFRYGSAPRTNMDLVHIIDLRHLPRPWKGVDADVVRGTDAKFAQRLFDDPTVAAFWPKVLNEVQGFLDFVNYTCLVSSAAATPARPLSLIHI